MMYKQLQQQHGVGMIEILIAIIILSVGLLGIAATQSIAVKETGSSSQRTAAMFLINDLIERMHANPKASGSYKSFIDAHGKDSNCRASKNCAGGNACNKSDLAAFDAAQVICKVDANGVASANNRSSNIYYLSQPEITMECDNSCVYTDGASITATIRVNWKESKNKNKKGGTNKGFVEVKAGI